MEKALSGHMSGYEVSCFAWSPDGSRLASASVDGTVRVRDVITGREVARLEGHDECATSCAWSPDGARLASESFDGTVRVLDVITGRELARLEGHAGQVTSSWLKFMSANMQGDPRGMSEGMAAAAAHSPSGDAAAPASAAPAASTATAGSSPRAERARYVEEAATANDDGGGGGSSGNGGAGGGGSDGGNHTLQVAIQGKKATPRKLTEAQANIKKEKQKKRTAPDYFGGSLLW